MSSKPRKSAGSSSSSSSSSPSPSASQSPTSPPPTRYASHSGSWYSSDPDVLSSQLNGWLSAAKEDQKVPQTASSPNAVCRGIICPHAGYSYSGPTAAYSYMNIPPSAKRLFVLGPSHHYHTRGCEVTANRVYATPVGNLDVDVEVTSKLLDSGEFSPMAADVDEAEHSIEMQMPYIALIAKQRGTPITIVPVLVGALSDSSEKKYGKVFSSFFDDPSNFFVISSDFCHWGQRFQYQPYDDKKGEIHQYISYLDHQGMDAIESMDPSAFSSYEKECSNTICGRHPIAVMLQACHFAKDKQKGKFYFIHYAQSSACRRMTDSSVSYASAVLKLETELSEKEKKKEKEKEPKQK